MRAGGTITTAYGGQEATRTFTAIFVGVPVATDIRFSAGIMVQSEHVT